MMSNDQVQDRLNKLLGTLRDGEKGFADAAEHATDPQLKSLFTERSGQRATLATEIEQHVTRLGDTPREGGSVGAALHRTWLNVRDAVTGRDDYAVVAEAERGEDVAIQNYQDVLDDAELPADVRSVVEAQYAKVKASHDQIRDLKRGMKAD
ncbi:MULTISPECIES: PA2169 family four-helix-bundle protein [Deinococcus]|uniref:PA2169 family four-helix-bundle protein n=1 Tax=Deinococcus rufus TaxID=2136097 RepID=A0ABV7ZGF1_9DEIO|nr:PA2169 family four-helix-bundle protein [Deinococcus sp. AB2017081]WQE96860.1 PA2169 family four-helix-bundle protein [Deinococcus sp. AB2017081]